ncbi:hypothetical protein N7532_009363 [Penicillium argentinense]|uniref:Uncharacterized protein n=1 Tax=Penicillium argentinense TaxID=1131581 RepID=A0A9W9EZ42_9EURO|nr:uncharacterized protein N7532_009363 [Penicillium argentinense]KAJ5090679.1 hypothetical protein N7532_009363 [Penicillium argentinense]
MPRDNVTYWRLWDREGNAYNFNASCQITQPLGNAAITNPEFTIDHANGSEHYRSVEFDRDITWHVYSGFKPRASSDLRLHEDIDNSKFTGVTNPLIIFGHAKIGYDPSFFDSPDPTKGVSNQEINRDVTTVETSNIDYGNEFWNECHVLEANIQFPKSAFGTWHEFHVIPVEFASYGINAMPLPQDLLVGSSSFGCLEKNGRKELFQLRSTPGDPSTQRVASIGLGHVMTNIVNSSNMVALQKDGEDVNGTAYAIEVYVGATEQLQVGCKKRQQANMFNFGVSREKKNLRLEREGADAEAS